MKFDDVLKHVGEFGLYQKRVYFLLCLFTITHGMRMVVMVFTLNVPKHRCAIPHYLNDTYSVTSYDHEVALNMSIPSGDYCRIYSLGNYSLDTNHKPINGSLEKCDKWVFDTSVFESTGASQFSLVCDNASKTTQSSMTFYGGYLIGTYALGALSDLIGRKSCLFLSMALLTALGLGQSFANSFISFTILNFCVGMAMTGIFPSAYIIGVEIVGPSKRTNTGMTMQLFFSTGVICIAGLAYLIRSWSYLLIAMTAPMVLLFPMWCFIPESPRWQIQKTHFSKARKTVLKAAKVNKKNVPDWVLDAVMPIDKKKDKHSEETANVQKGQFIDLFKSKTLCIRTCIVFFIWLVMNLAFYGLIFNTSNLGFGSIFLNLFLTGLAEFPAELLAFFTIDRLGRKFVISGMMFTSGIGCIGCVLSILFVPEDQQWLTIVLAMIGKFGATGAIGTMYMYTSELFPTVIRHTALGVSTSWGRIGAILAPFVAAEGAKSTGSLGRSLPLLVFGCLILFAGTLMYFLPETLNRKLPETVKDTKNFARLPTQTQETGEKNDCEKKLTEDVTDC